MIRPFYALDTRWSAGATLFDDTREVSFYDVGDEAAEYAVDRDFHSFYYGWSVGRPGRLGPALVCRGRL